MVCIPRGRSFIMGTGKSSCLEYTMSQKLRTCVKVLKLFKL